MSAPKPPIPDKVLAEVDAALRAGLRDWTRTLLGEPDIATSGDLRWGAKGSKSVVLDGKSKGVCADFEAGIFTGPLGFIQHLRGCDFRDAVTWAAGWAGIKLDDADAVKESAADQRKRLEAERIAREQREAESADAAAEREEGARRWWRQRLPLTDAIGAAYLASRGITEPAGGWPDAIGWVTHRSVSLGVIGKSYPCAGSVIVAATDADGVVRAVQRVALDADARNVRGEGGAKLKPTRGAVSAYNAVVRLPGASDGPLLLAEGPETGLSVWLSTGHETWIGLGSIARHRPPAGRRVVACRDDDAPASPADKALTKALAGWAATGCQVVVATPWATRRHDKSDFNDVLQDGGAEAVRARIEAALHPHGAAPKRVSLRTARAELAAGVDEFFAAAGGFHREVEAITRNVLPKHLAQAVEEMPEAAWDWHQARQGVAQARAAVEASAGPEEAQKARATLSAALARRSAASAALTAEERRAADRLLRRAERDAEAEAARIAGDPPVHALRVDVGGGKSAAAREGAARLLRQMRAAGDERCGLLAVPTVALGDDQATEFAKLRDAKAAGLKARVWRGRERPDPNAPGFDDPAIPDDKKARMCLDLDAVADAQAALADPQTAVCERKMPDGEVRRCPFFETCAYQAQRQAKADLWITAHEILFGAKPAAIGEPAFVVVDEGFAQAGLIGIGQKATRLSLESLRHDAVVPSDGFGSQRLAFLRSTVADCLDAMPDGPVQRDAILATGIEAGGAIEARKLEWQRKADVAIYPGMPRSERRKAVEAAQANSGIPKLAQLWHGIEALAADGGPAASGWLTLSTVDAQDEGKVRSVILKGRREIGSAWKSAPTLVIDATLQPELVRPFFPNVAVTRDIAIAMPHQHVTQVSDKAYSKTHLEDSAHGLRDVHAIIVREAARHAGQVLVVAQKGAREKLEAFGITPRNAVFAHHNAVAGIDRWRDADALIVIGRTSPKPTDVERMAEALTGEAIEPVERYLKAEAAREMEDGSMVPAEADRHPHPVAEAFRWRVCEGELVQILGRLRGASRTTSKPAHVLVLTNPVLPTPVARIVSHHAVAPSIADRQIAAGGVFLENPADAAKAYPNIWETPKASRLCYSRVDPSSLPQFPYNNYMENEVENGRYWSVTPLRATYQLTGRGMRLCGAWFRPDLIPDPSAWLTERLGPLARCQVEQPGRGAPSVDPAVPTIPTDRKPALAVIQGGRADDFDPNMPITDAAMLRGPIESARRARVALG